MGFDRYRERIKTIFNKEKVIRFLDKQGFYIVLFICISIIGVTALLTYGREADPQDGVDGDIPPLEEMAGGDLITENSTEDEQETEDIEIEVKDVLPDDSKKDEQPNTSMPNSTDSEQVEDSKSEPFPGEQTSPQATEETLGKSEVQTVREDEVSEDNKVGDKEDNTDARPTASQGGTSKSAMVYPVEGEVIKQYSMDELVYSNTLNEWTVHPGMDIESFLGAEVKAAMAGIVEKVEEDPLMGIAITLDHGNGVKTRYANLSTANMVIEGQEIEAGQIISGVGRTAGAEILDAPHLHFEFIVDEEYVNPIEYLE